VHNFSSEKACYYTLFWSFQGIWVLPKCINVEFPRSDGLVDLAAREADIAMRVDDVVTMALAVVNLRPSGIHYLCNTLLLPEYVHKKNWGS